MRHSNLYDRGQDVNAPVDEPVWYLARDGKQHGPISDLEMNKLLEFGHLRETDLLWRPGFADWSPAPSVFPANFAPPEPVPLPTEPPFQSVARSNLAERQHEVDSHPFVDSRSEVQRPDRTQQPFGYAAGVDEAHAAAPYPSETRALDNPFQAAPRPLDDFPERARSTRSGRGAIVALGVIALVGSAAAGGYVYRDAIMATVASLTAQSPSAESRTSPSSPPTPTAATPQQPAAKPQSATPTGVAPSAPPASASDPAASSPTFATPQNLAGDPFGGVVVTTAFPPAKPKDPIDTSALDAQWQKQPLWSLLKAEFPDWYAERLDEIGRMKAANQPDSEIDAKLVSGLIALRRQHAGQALAAGPERLQAIATAFIGNLTSLQKSSVDACYGFISKGEATPQIAAFIQKPDEGRLLHAQFEAVFNAVVEGRKSPVKRGQPQKADYDLLAAELGKLGWSQADIQLFADPKALAQAPRERVCTMVREWFSAHLAVKDSGARERLLTDTLRPLVTG